MVTFFRLWARAPFTLIDEAITEFFTLLTNYRYELIHVSIKNIQIIS